MSQRQIPNSLLRRTHLPPARAAWRDLEAFAQTFDGYGYFGSDSAAEVSARTEKLRATGLLELASIPELRNYLFFEQRTAHHNSEDPADLTPYQAVVEALRTRVEDAPLIDVSDEALDADVHGDPIPALWFGAMLDGLMDERPLLAPLLCRVAPESAVVACAARGLLRVLRPRTEWCVRLEEHDRVDLVVEQGNEQWAFEWKLLWGLGTGEGIGGIRKDREKLRARGGRGCALVFAYAVISAPEQHGRRVTKEPLAITVAKAIEALGPPTLESRNIEIMDEDVNALFRLLAWT